MSAHDFGVNPRVLVVTPTRDNLTAPGARMRDKHTRLFHGKTLDEWLMIQLWSSRCMEGGKVVFVAETRDHAERIEKLAVKYAPLIHVVPRPTEMLARVNDTGSIPVNWAVEREFRSDWFSIIITPFVVAPVRPPGFFDRMVDDYLERMTNPDYVRGQALVVGGYPTDVTLFEVDHDMRGTQLGTAYLNRNFSVRGTIMNHAVFASWWYRSFHHVQNSRHQIALEPWIVPIPWWTDIHIDDEDDWANAEFWFARKILSQGEDCYETYRRSWAG